MDPSSTPPTGTTAPQFKDAVQQGKRASQVMAGLLLIALGCLFLVDEMGDQWGWHVSFKQIWPLLLIVAGLGVSLSHRDTEITVRQNPDGTAVQVERGRRRYGDGLMLIMVGVLMFAHMNKWMLLSQSWPLFVVAGGLSMMFGSRRARTSRRERR